jgi:hypothetical protein
MLHSLLSLAWRQINKKAGTISHDSTYLIIFSYLSFDE